MFMLLILSCLISLSNIFENVSNITNDDYNLLPPIYGMGDYEKCDLINNFYYKVDIKLKPHNQHQKIWKRIEATKKNKYLFNHDEIYRTICVPKIYENSSKDLKIFITNIVNRQVQKVNLTSVVQKITYLGPYSYTTTDKLIMMTISGYLSLIFFATVFDINGRKSKTTVNDIILAFSLRRNFEKIFDRNKNVHYQNLKCIQGLRTITCIFIIWLHTRLGFMLSFVDNAKVIEELYQKYAFQAYITLAFFLTQTFSLISAWLLTVQVYSLCEKGGGFTIKDVFILFVNRVCRIWPLLVAAMICSRTFLVKLLTSGPLIDALHATTSSCENHWPRSLLFIQNMFYGINVCNEGYWFMSMDVQLHLVCLLVLYLIFKFRSPSKILKMCLLVSYVLYGTVIYMKNMNVIPRVDPEMFKWFNFLNDDSMLYVYKMPQANMGTYILGICFGTFYYKQYQTGVKHQQISSMVWVPAFLLVPTLAIVAATKESKGISAALLGPLLRPLYAFGIGMGILGMSQNSKGILKKIFEWRPLEFLGQFTYSTYVSHFLFTGLRTVMHEPFKVSSYHIRVTAHLQDAIFAFMLGFIVYLMIELPWRHLQKMFIPQARKGRREPIKQ